MTLQARYDNTTPLLLFPVVLRFVTIVVLSTVTVVARRENNIFGLHCSNGTGQPSGRLKRKACVQYANRLLIDFIYHVEILVVEQEALSSLPTTGW